MGVEETSFSGAIGQIKCALCLVNAYLCGSMANTAESGSKSCYCCEGVDAGLASLLGVFVTLLRPAKR